ncbi:beta-L-arabinofuranosidase domain-containing protein [Conexibacter woesei]|uniref:Acetyl-CoA carboxylase, biotin carboxylase n=1 Tax=Conexibacter woesei (strain DSM 14684 / CCUG 47730 / CIP 108061 / JCM 11494 / NBRC 100937 / ID131577) TaxID=469383 RepID=D3F384_CONWI|nr:beta-L-arabinofuranosidase domain-containing protein [Conexibacter woesei]ADB50364.1 protein of unknown function DUF1680 [Conexibacter woesei DSM 14684]
MRDSATSASSGRKILTAMNYQGVELGDCRQRRQLEEACATFAGVSNDALLYPFRIRKGSWAPGIPLRGWYGEGLFNNLGQFFTLYARLYAATGEHRFAEKALALLDGWEETIEEDGGFLSSHFAGTVEYSYDKLVCGLLDLHEYVGSERALPVLERVSRWMQRHGGSSKPYAWSGMGPLEWYTLPEYLLRAYAVTSDPLYRELANAYRYDEFYDALLERDVGALMRRADEARNFYQAHSHANTLNSAAAVYETTGDPRYLDVLTAGYELLRESQTFATGMFGPLEAFMKPRQRVEVLHSEEGHAEVACPSWAMMRLVRHLIELTGEAQFGDWMELNVYNGIGSAPPTRADGRATQYFADYGLDRATKTWGVEWSCCSTTSGINMAEYVNQIYYAGPDALHVCLYLPSSVTCEIDGATLWLTQRTAYPVDERVAFDVRVERPLRGTIAFRVPAWTAGEPRLTLDGEPVEHVVRDGWATVERTWEDGDAIELTLPMELAVLPVEPATDAGPVALRYGPVVLVAPQDERSRRLSLGDVAAVASSLRRTDAARLAFEGRAADGSVVALVPYYELEPGAPYAMHFDDDGDRRSHAQLAYEPADAWEQVDREQYLLRRRRRYAVSAVPGASFSAAFEGTGVLWCGYRSVHAGWADVFLDGELVERVTQLGHSDLQPSLWCRTGLAPGPHVLRVVVAGERPPGARGDEVNVGHLRVLS